MAETTWDNVKGEPYSTFFTDDKKFFKYVDKCLKENPENFSLVFDNRDEEDGGVMIRTPKNQLKPPRPVKKRDMTDEQRAAQSERAKKAQEARKNKIKEQ